VVRKITTRFAGAVPLANKKSSIPNHKWQKSPNIRAAMFK
jgi:hypothetical protein